MKKFAPGFLPIVRCGRIRVDTGLALEPSGFYLFVSVFRRGNKLARGVGVPTMCLSGPKYPTITIIVEIPKRTCSSSGTWALERPAVSNDKA